MELIATVIAWVLVAPIFLLCLLAALWIGLLIVMLLATILWTLCSVIWVCLEGAFGAIFGGLK